MPERKRLFMKILKAELEDCLEDVEDLKNLYERRLLKNDVTNYVYNENEALLKRELDGIRKALDALDSIDVDTYENLDTLAAAVDAVIQKKVLEYEDPEAVYQIAKRKLLKVLRYVNERINL
uniref:Uncharacterized protein n=1 Tax=Gracilinema caldarium TaxID=215591 RepID=A0A7C3E131_9SPIR